MLYIVYMKNINENKTIQPKSLSRASYAYEKLLGAIEKHEVQPGQPLIELELCEWLNMSRTPIREALNRLRAEGMVEYRHPRGYYVSYMSKDRFRQIYEMIEALEGMLAYLLACDHSHPNFKKVGKAIADMEKTAKAELWDDWIIADAMFHKYMCSCCDNIYIVRELELMGKASHQVRIMITRMFLDKTQSTIDHRNVYDAIVAADPDKARRLAQDHFSRIRGNILEYIGTYRLFNDHSRMENQD